LGIGHVQGVAARIEIGTKVVKSGRTTGVTWGKIKLTDLDIFVRYPSGIALFVDQIMVASIGVEPVIIQPGVSGSPLCSFSTRRR
ncbi:MAG: hypothetical protein COX14_00755, partial [Chloroflexi bacterium CG23_combo_of_CG06-09_8_20_14_all_45_10]